MTKESSKRHKFITKAEKKLARKIRRLAKLFSEFVIDHFSKEFKIKDGVITNSTSNIATARKFERLKEKFLKKEVAPIMVELSKELQKIHKLNLGYFKSIPDLKNSKVEFAHTKVTNKLLNRYGFDTKKVEIIKDGFLYDFAKMDDVFKKIKGEALKSALGGVPLSKFRENVDKYVVKDKGVEKHFRRLTQNVYSQFERSSANQVREELGLSFAILQGGIIETTRDWCRLRNDQVFHISEILKMGTSADTYGGYTDKSTGDFQGRNKNKTYDPIEDAGDENCRHSWDWISNKMALRRRPDVVQFLN